MLVVLRNAGLVFLLWMSLSALVFFLLTTYVDGFDPTVPVVIAQIFFMGLPAIFLIKKEDPDQPVFKAESFGKANLYFVIVLAWISLLAFNNALLSFVYNILPEPFKGQYIEMFRNSDIYRLLDSSGLNIYALAFIIGLAPAFGEELLFRRYLFDSMMKKTSPQIALYVSSFFFAVVHFMPAALIQYFLIGILFGLIYYRTRNIYIVMIMHFINNFIAVLSVKLYSGGNEFSTDFGIPEALVLFISGIVFYHTVKSFISGRFWTFEL